MKAIAQGSTYRVYPGQNIQTYDKLPSATFIIAFDELTGFFLEKTEDIDVNEAIYGDVDKKAKHVLESYNKMDRNLGVILSGDKGLGKSFFAKRLSQLARDIGMPTIRVSGFKPGLPEFINNITQDVIIFFDEFDKTFSQDIRTEDNAADPQATMLSLFDGTSSGKKLFVVTCNDVFGLNDYLVNRTGRFHYHFRFAAPTEDELRRYCEDHLSPNKHNQIDSVVSFSRKTPLSFDLLRAICFELENYDEPFDIAIHMLNILNTDEAYYDGLAHFKNGIMKGQSIKFNIEMNPWDDEEQQYHLYYNSGYLYFRFDPANLNYDIRTGSLRLDGKDIEVTSANENDINAELDFIVFRRKTSNYGFKLA